MGPILILDKSALESLNVDQSVWLEMFFSSNITPLLYVETLADLEKSDKTGRSSERIVADLASKTPANTVFPNVHHHQLIIQDFFGNTPPLDTHQVVVSGGQAKKDSEGKLGIHIDEFPELAALGRWFKGEFSEIERKYAKNWREILNGLNPEATIELVQNMTSGGKRFSGITEVKEFSDEFVKKAGPEKLNFGLHLLGIPNEMRFPILKRYTDFGRPPLQQFAPYAAFVLKIEVFYYLCLRQGFIDKERASNKADIAYLYYLPFCHAFVSKDNLHTRTAELFMENDQHFVPAEKLKSALAELDNYFSRFKDEIERVGLMKFVGYPPPDMDNVVTQLWDRFMRPDWRKIEKERQAGDDGMPSDEEILKMLRKNHEEATPVSHPVDTSRADYFMIGRKASLRKGKWRILPPEVEEVREAGSSPD